MNAWLCIWCCWCTQVIFPSMYFVSVPYKTIDKEKHGIPLMPHILPSGSISWFIFLLLFATSRCSINSQLLQKKLPRQAPGCVEPFVRLKRQRTGRHVIGQRATVAVPGHRGGNVVLCAAISEHGVLHSTSNNVWYWAQFELFQSKSLVLQEEPEVVWMEFDNWVCSYGLRKSWKVSRNVS